MLYKMLLSALFLLLCGCAVYGDGYGRGYHSGYGYGYYEGYRRDHYLPPVYVVPRYYYEDRRHHYYPAPPRYVPTPSPPPRYGHERHNLDGYPRHDERRDARRQELRGGSNQRGWDAGRHTQQRLSNGRSQNQNPPRSNAERRW